MIELLPDSRLKRPVNTVMISGMSWMPIFCINCGSAGGLVPEHFCTFAHYQCDPCFEKYPLIPGTHVEPMVVFWEKVKQAQLEMYGRELTPYELQEALKDENHILSKLAKDKPK